MNMTETQLAHKRRFMDFLDGDHGHGAYVDKIRDMVEDGQHRLMVDLSDLREYDLDLARRMTLEPSEYMGPLESALEDMVRNLDAKYLQEGEEVRVGFTGSFGFFRVSPRDLLSPFLTHMVNVEGIVTKCSLVRPKVVKSVHYCEATKGFEQREYRDVTSYDGLPTGAVYPTRDAHGNLLATEYGLCHYRDHQTIAIQEMPENAPPGQLPCSIDVILEDDLVDQCKPGDRVSLVGIYRAVPTRSNGNLTGVFRTVIIANSIRRLSKEASNIQFTSSDLKNLRKLSQKENVLDMLANSFAPSIYGHHYIKKAIILQMLGGVEKNLDNGTHLRGDINLLMVGDPGVAKSQLLRAVMNISPLAISTTGRGSSGVGLTAAVTTDNDTGERRLEAGAMVLADRGIVCIDEFDKMNELDRVAIHEVMEQQTVTIAKAGIHTSLNARCSVIAAANPIYGSYDHHISVTRNIALPDSLLSRFDLLFVVLDQMSPRNDKLISEHVLRMHRYRKPGDDGTILGAGAYASTTRVEDEDDVDEEGETPVFVKYDRNLHGPRSSRAGGDTHEPLSVPFLRKYIHYAKTKSPALTEDACQVISRAYGEMRQDSTDKTLPVTARTLETMIRLATAHAKLRFSSTVEDTDAEVALELMRQALYASETEKSAKDAAVKKTRRREEPDEDEDQERPGPAGSVEAVPSPGKTRERKARKVAPTELVEDEGAAGPSSVQAVDVTPEQVSRVQKLILEAFAGEQQWTTEADLVEKLATGSPVVNQQEVKAILAKMNEENRIMVAEGKIYAI